MTAAAAAERLDDRRPSVQDRAVRELAARGGDAIAVLAETASASSSIDARRNAVWALTRIDAPAAREAVRGTLADRDASVQQAALHSTGLWKDPGGLARVREALESPTPAVRRAAAEALGRIGDPRAVPDLLAAAAAPLDRVLEHSIVYALIEIGDPASTRAGLQAANSRATRAALIALDQMDNGALSPDRVVPLLESPDPILKDTAWWIAAHHVEWGGALADFFAARLKSPGTRPEDLDELQQRLAHFGENPGVQALLGRIVERAASSPERLTALRAMAVVVRTRVKILPAVWVTPLVRVLESDDDDAVAQALGVVRAVPAPKEAAAALSEALLGVSRNAGRPIEVRLTALGAVTAKLTRIDADLFSLLQAGLAAGQPPAVHAAAVGGIETSSLDPSQLVALAPALQAAAPLDLPRLLRAFDRPGDESVGLAMLGALRDAKSRSSVRADLLRPLLARYPDAVQKQGEALLTSLDADAANQVRRLEALLPVVGGGNVARGQAVFNGPKAGCYACHAIGYIGGRVGPDLTRIGEVRSQRDLLEAIVFPSASFARGYEPIVVRTRSGAVHLGVLRNNDLDDEVVVATDRDEIRIPRREIVDMQPGTVSLMPQGFGEVLTRQELADVLAFLAATRWGAN
jgi:putative heme-binding domain-containing protein